VHTTQFAIREVGLFEPVLALAAEEMDRAAGPAPVRVAGVCGPTAQAVGEAAVAARLGYHAGLVSLAALPQATVPALLDHVRAVGEVLPVFGFYLQPAAGGRDLPFDFWRRLAELEAVVAVKVAPFDRYRTLDVLRAVAESGRADQIALYTGNDDHIVADLLTPYDMARDRPPARFVGGLLGQWAVWTRRAVELHAHCRAVARSGGPIPERLLALGAQLTDANGAIFDAAHRYAGCLPGIHAVLAAQGLLAGTWCLDPRAELSPGQGAEIARVRAAYPHLGDDDFVAEHRDRWLA
jgi:dihydrodipicolinate synthase/N-acetylneuraminate lyase